MGGGRDLKSSSVITLPYESTLNSNIILNIEDAIISLIDLSYYAQNKIPNYTTITEIPQENLNYLNSGLRTNNMNYMFDSCFKLTSIPKLNIDTSQCTDMYSMFNGCNSLTSLDLSSFNTSNVTNMYSMFEDCNKLTSLDLSSFNTSKVTNMRYMFENCNSLTSLDLSNFNTSNVTNMFSMFYGCNSLTSLDLSNFNTSKVTNMSYMFYGCNSLTSLDLSNFDTSKVTNMSYMFYDCNSLTTIKGVIDMKSCTGSEYYDMFHNCTKLKGVQIKNPPGWFDGGGLNSDQYTIVS